MNAGLPSAGIGVTFYLLATLWMPFYELFHVFKKRVIVPRWQFVITQFSIALNVILGISLANWLVDTANPPDYKAVLNLNIVSTRHQIAERLHLPTVLLVPVALVIILVSIEFISFIWSWLKNRAKVRERQRR